jgi:hypothetical protein
MSDVQHDQMPGAVAPADTTVTIPSPDGVDVTVTYADSGDVSIVGPGTEMTVPVFVPAAAPGDSTSGT